MAEARRGWRAWLHPGWSWTVRQAWVTASLATAFTLFLGAGLGVIPALPAGNWHDAQTRDQAWVGAGFFAACLAALAIALFLIRQRRRVLAEHGTAYVIQEVAEDWARDGARDFLAEAGRYFARDISVPGPGRLGGSWRWPLGEGAQRWDPKVDELVRSFQALQSDDDPRTPNGIFMWAWWAVALAFGSRVTAADRSLALDVWQRPGRGRAGEVKPDLWLQKPHRFGSGELTRLPPDSMPREFPWPVTLAVKHRGARPGHAEGGGIGLLLLRLGWQPWGPLGSTREEPGPDRHLSLTIHDAAGVAPGGTSEVTLHELRCVPPGGQDTFPWECFPSLVAESADWIASKARELKGRTLLVGTVMPPEAALGLGIRAGQDGCDGWPGQLWPVVYRKSADAFVVPRLDLGTAAFRDRPADG